MSKIVTVKNFGGKYKINNEWIYIKKVIYNCPATIVFWNDNTKTISKCQSPDVYSKEVGLLLCVMKKLHGNDEVRKLLRDWTINTLNPSVITAADVRKSYKDRGEVFTYNTPDFVKTVSLTSKNVTLNDVLFR